MFTQPTAIAMEAIPFIPPPAPDRWKLQDLERTVDRLAHNYNIDRERWYTLIDLESNWDRFAVSKKNASGICQIWPPTARGYGLSGETMDIIIQLQDPNINLPICARLLRNLLDRYDGDWFIVAVAFNAGPSVVTYAQEIIC